MLAGIQSPPLNPTVRAGPRLDSLRSPETSLGESAQAVGHVLELDVQVLGEVSREPFKLQAKSER